MLNYPNNTYVIWTVNSDCDEVYVSTEMMDIEDGYDFFVIQGTQIEEAVFLTSTGTMPLNVELDGAAFEALFAADREVSYPGFIVSWGCTDMSTTTAAVKTSAATTIGMSLTLIIK